MRNFTKRYQYKIRDSALKEFIEIQTNAKKFYQDRVNVKLNFYINDNFEVTEYNTYLKKEDYIKMSKNTDKELLNLYERFKDLVIGEILEDDVDELIVEVDHGKN